MRYIWLAALMLVTGLGTSAALEPGVARACSCAAPVSAANLLGSRPTGFVGIPLERRHDADSPEGWLRVVYEVEVVDAIKGTLPRVVELHTGEGGGDCGVDLDLGREVGLIPHQYRGLDTIGMCGGVMSPDELRDVRDATLPEPTGVGAVAALVQARAGPAPVVAVDAQFAPLGYVAMSGEVTELATCPGATRAITLGYVGEQVLLRVIDVATLTVVRQTVVAELVTGEAPQPWWFFSTLSCLNEDGDAVAFAREGQETDAVMRSLSADGVGEPVDLAFVLGVEAVDGVVYALTSDTLTTRAADGSVTGTIATFAEAELGVAFGIDDAAAYVGLDTAGVFDGVIDTIMRVPLDGAPATRAQLPRLVSHPTITVTASDIAVQSPNEGHALLLGNDLAVLAEGTYPMWPAGDGYLTWTFFPDVIEAHLGGETTSVLEFAADPRSVVALRDGPTVAPDAPGARALPIVDEPGVIVGRPAAVVLSPTVQRFVRVLEIILCRCWSPTTTG